MRRWNALPEKWSVWPRLQQYWLAVPGRTPLYFHTPLNLQTSHCALALTPATSCSRIQVKRTGRIVKSSFAVSGKTYAGFSGTDFHGFQIVTFFILKGQFSPPFFLYLCVPLSLTIEVLTQRMVLNFKFWNEDVIEVWKTGQVDSDLLFVYVKIA